MKQVNTVIKEYIYIERIYRLTKLFEGVHLVKLGNLIFLFFLILTKCSPAKCYPQCFTYPHHRLFLVFNFVEIYLSYCEYQEFLNVFL